jgi:tetratricopeptide (TPR) repeat protein
MLAAPKDAYTRAEALRMVGISEQQLRGWEKQQLVPRLDAFAFSDLIALRSLEKLRRSRVPPRRIRQTVQALRTKLKDVADPLKELKIVCEGKRVAVVFEGQKLEPVSGQLLLDFDRAELTSLLAFPRKRAGAGSAPAARLKEAERWFEKGLELEQIGAPLDDIIDAYQRALALDPNSAGAQVNLGTVYYHLHQWDQAEKCYQLALGVDPQYALAHFNLGNLFDEKGDRRRAMSHYQEALGINPSYADAHYNLALLCQTQGELLKAVRHWKAYLKLDGSSTWARIARGELDKLRRASVLEGGTQGTAGPFQTLDGRTHVDGDPAAG